MPTVALAVRHAAPLRDPAVLARRITAQHKLAVALGEVPANISAVTLGQHHCPRLLQRHREFEGRVAGVLVPHAIDEIAAFAKERLGANAGGAPSTPGAPTSRPRRERDATTASSPFESVRPWSPYV